MRMRTITHERRQQGYALAITMCFTAVMLIVFAGMLSWSSNNSMLTERNNLYNQSEIAAESATEKALAAMISDFNINTALGSSSYYSGLVPDTSGWPVGYTFSDTNGEANQISVSIGPNLYTPNVPGQLTGIYGQGCDVTIAAEAAPVGQRYNMTGKVTQTAWFGIIPLFQFAIFYNMDLEINPGSAMTVNGRVHSNENLYATGAGSGSLLNFGSSVDAALTATNHSSPLDPRNPPRSGYVTYSNTNYPLQHYGTFNLPIGANSTNSDANNPTNVLAILNPPPSAYAPPNYSAAYDSTNGQSYFENRVDLIITNAPNGTNGTYGTNIAVYYQNQNNSASPITYVQPDVTNLVTGATSYSFVTNGSYYDYRESATVQSVDIDVSKLTTWMTSGKGATYNTQNTTGSTSKNHNINSIYVYNSVPLKPTQMPAVRMLNGQQMPTLDGLTIATPDPIYVKGNYNTTTDGTHFSTALGDTTYTRPAALLGDALTLLSSNWKDTYTSSTSLSTRSPTDTTLNAATMEGIVPSNGSQYSGGVENFVRLLENWSGHTIYYNGSIVVMYPSQYATNFWSGSYYSVPTRKWGFDLNFTNQTKLPPLTPHAKALFRASWSAN